MALFTVDMIGWIAGLCFAISGIPQAVKAIREGHSMGVSSGLIFLILSGSSLMLLYELLTAQSLPQIFDFAVTAGVWAVVARYKLFPRPHSSQVIYS